MLPVVVPREQPEVPEFAPYFLLHHGNWGDHCRAYFVQLGEESFRRAAVAVNQKLLVVQAFGPSSDSDLDRDFLVVVAED